MRKSYLNFFFILFVAFSSLGTSVYYDTRTISELLIDENIPTYFTCKITSHESVLVDSIGVANGIRHAGSYNHYYWAKITQTHLGKIDSLYVRIQGKYVIGQLYLVRCYGSNPLITSGVVTSKMENNYENKINIIKKVADIIKTGKSGKQKFYFSNEVLMAKGKFKKGIPVGSWKHYYKSGQLKSKLIMVNGKKDGEVTGYLESGEVGFNGIYVEGKLLRNK